MFGATLTLVALVVFWYMLALFFVALKRRDNSIVDSAWGPGFLLAVLATVLWHRPSGLLVSLVIALVAMWAIRLSVHILARNWDRGEDWRYAQWRREWGAFFVLRSFLQVFVLQGFLMILVALPALWVATFGGGITRGALVGAGVWLIGFLWEAIGDGQLTAFLKNPANKGRVMKSGLWKYSRHPNYFGEMTQWWGMWLIALTLPGGWMTIVGPLTITFLIMKVSGVPLLEKKQMQNPEFQEYARHTSTVIPWFPKNKKR
jgi:steroid 5-alpha reductase family enzyme